MEMISLADKYVNMIRRLKRENPNLKIFISMVLPRYDELEFSNGNDIVNAEISRQLSKENRVFLMSNDHLEEMDFIQEDKFHLSKAGFVKMAQKWRSAIGTKIF